MRLYSPTAWFSLPNVHRETYGNVSSNYIPPKLLSPHNHKVETIGVANTNNQAFQGVPYHPTAPAGSRFPHRHSHIGYSTTISFFCESDSQLTRNFAAIKSKHWRVHSETCYKVSKWIAVTPVFEWTYTVLAVAIGFATTIRFLILSCTPPINRWFLWNDTESRERRPAPWFNSGVIICWYSSLKRVADNKQSSLNQLPPNFHRCCSALYHWGWGVKNVISVYLWTHESFWQHWSISLDWMYAWRLLQHDVHLIFKWASNSSPTTATPKLHRVEPFVT